MQQPPIKCIIITSCRLLDQKVDMPQCKLSTDIDLEPVKDITDWSNFCCREENLSLTYLLEITPKLTTTTLDLKKLETSRYHKV